MSSHIISNDNETLQTITEDLFHGMVKEAATTGEPLCLTGRRVVISKPVKLARSESLHIVGGTLVGECHSIFSIGTDRTKGPPALILKGCTLEHMLTSTDRREIGACVFVMGKARVEIHDSNLSSVAGFGLWLKHGGSATVERCSFLSAGRTSIACFNEARAVCNGCSITRGAVHGVCLRSDAVATLHRCVIRHCGNRGCYVYERGTLHLEDCVVTGTQSPACAAVEALGCAVAPPKPPDSTSIDPSVEPGTQRNRPQLSIVRCRVHANACPGIAVIGSVVCHFEDLEVDTPISFEKLPKENVLAASLSPFSASAVDAQLESTK